MKVVWNDTGSVAYMNGMSAAFKVSDPRPTSPILKPSVGMTQGDITPWGSDNLFPQHIIEEVRKSTLIPSTLLKQAHMLQSSGMIYGKVTGFDKDGREVMEYEYDPEVEAWLKRTNIKRYLREASLSYHWFYNLFPELILSRDRKQIVSIMSQRPENCRWEKQNTKTGYVDNCFISANWEMLQGISDKKYVTKVPTIDPYFDAAYNLQHSNSFKHIYPLSYPSPGTTFYQLAPWNGMRESGWLDVSLSVPAFKKALFKNQITLKYVIEVSTWWWNWQYPGFDQFDASKKKQIMDKELERFEVFMKGEENAGKAIFTTYQSDPMYQKKYDGWTITVVDDKLKDGIYIEDSQEAASHLLYALGWDPTLTGPIPGRNGMGAGSGSDKRVAGEMYLSMIEPHREIVLEPIQFAFDYNWPDKQYKVKFINSRITPLSEGEGLKKEAA